MNDKALSQKIIDEVERKIKALDFVNDIKKAFLDEDNYKPLGDCPLYGKLPETYIFDCRNKNITNCNINNTTCRRFR